jgi:hypothetical protein
MRLIEDRNADPIRFSKNTIVCGKPTGKPKTARIPSAVGDGAVSYQKKSNRLHETHHTGDKLRDSGACLHDAESAVSPRYLRDHAGGTTPQH